MKRGELYRVSHPSARDPKRYRVLVIVSRQVLIDSRFSTVICAPIYTAYGGLATEVPVGPDEGLKHKSSIHCAELVSLAKSMLANNIGTLPPTKLELLIRRCESRRRSRISAAMLTGRADHDMMLGVDEERKTP